MRIITKDKIKKETQATNFYQKPSTKPASEQVIGVISDLHFPFENEKAFSFLQSLQREYKFDDVVMIGDLVDHHQLSTFVKGGEAYSASQELQMVREKVKELGKIFPKMKVCFGNHCLRYLKRAKEIGMPIDYLKPYSEIIEAPKGWEFKDEFIIDNVLYCHGDSFGGATAGQQAIKTKYRSCVFGHTHQASIHYLNGLWACNVGCLISPKAYAYEYARFFKTQPTLGTAVIVRGVPHFIPMV